MPTWASVDWRNNATAVDVPHMHHAVERARHGHCGGCLFLEEIKILQQIIKPRHTYKILCC